MKRWLLLFCTLLALQAQGYNENILKIEANIIPRIALMDYKFMDKLQEGRITIYILHNDSDTITAQRMREIIRSKYPSGLKGYALDIRLQNYETFLLSPPKATVYYLMNALPRTIQAVVQTATRQRTLTFSHDTENLRYGANVSLMIDKKIIPYINVGSLKESGISLRPALLSISEIYQ